METLLWVMDYHPVMFWSVSTCFIGIVIVWGALTWEAVQLLETEDLHGGLNR